jgi:putative sporulation protein YyaC
MSNNKLFLNNDFNDLVYALSAKLCKFKTKPVILCLGTDKVIADSLGPIVGHLLTTKYNIRTYVYGSLKRTVNSVNLKSYYEHINKTHKEHNLLVVDAGLGNLKELGSINITSSGLIPYNNCYYKKIGDIGITGIVLEKGILQTKQLAKINLNFVNNMAEIIAKVIYNAYSIVY